jgi:hypothetical protein
MCLRIWHDGICMWLEEVAQNMGKIV